MLYNSGQLGEGDGGWVAMRRGMGGRGNRVSELLV